MQTTPAHQDIHEFYLRAAQQAEEGLLEESEAGFRAVVAAMPDLGTARFQLGQLLWVRGSAPEAVAVLAPLGQGESPLAAFARAIMAVASADTTAAIGELERGLAMPQDNAPLAADMRRLLERLREVPTVAPLFLSAYGTRE